MDKARRRELIRDHKERRARAGFYVVRCAGRAWVGAARPLVGFVNRGWSRGGSHLRADGSGRSRGDQRTPARRPPR